MKSKLVKYIFTSIVIAVSFWFYFQVTTYPYKVDRWLQPIEAKVIFATAKQCSSETSWLDLFVEHAIYHQGAYSAQVAFLNADAVLKSCQIGYKDRLFGTPINSTHRYRYASTSKLVTTTAILNLARQGKIGLDDTLISFFPELNQFKDERIRQITIAHLLSHKAGFNRLTLNGDPMFLRRNKPWCPNNFNELQTLTLTFNPGEKQIYSNLGYCLLGEVIHRVTSEPYRDYVEHEFSLAKRDIKFANNFYYDDEVRYDYRYEEWFNDSYLTLFDFDAISSSAGLSGSATALAQLLWDIHHTQNPSPFVLRTPAADCNLQKTTGCLNLGVFHYRPNKYGVTLHYHQGYLPGAASVAVIDSFGGVTVLVKSGADRDQQSPQNEWIEWIYNRLNLYYTLRGQLSVLSPTN